MTSKATRALLCILAGTLLGFFICFYVPLPHVDAQGVGFFGTSSTGTRTNCTQITDPVVGQTVCFDQAANVWRVYTGASTSTTNWVASVSTQTGVNNVRDFGATGNGTTDDTTAVIAAIGQLTSNGANTSRIVYFPPGYYRVSSTIEVPPNVILRGAGRFSTNVSATIGASIGCAFDGACLRFVRRNASAGSLWHMGGIEDMGMAGPESFSLVSTTAFRFIELGDANSVTTSTGTWEVFVRRMTFSNATGGYGIYSASSQLAMIERNWFTQVKFPIYYNTVAASARITGNTLLDQTNIAGAIAMQFRPGSLGGAAAPWIQGNYILGFQYGIWNTSIVGMIVRDNSFEDVYQVPIMLSARLSDLVTPDGSGPTGTVIDGNTFINWGNSGSGQNPAIQMSNASGGWIGGNSYLSPNAVAATAPMVNALDAGVRLNVIVEPVCAGVNCTSLASIPATFTAQNTILGSSIRVATAVFLNATRVLWNGTSTSSTPQCANNCGTAPSVVGHNTAMRITMGATGTPRSPFLVLFNGTWPAIPACIAQLDTATTTTVSVTNASTTGVLVNTVIGPSQGAVYSLHCMGPSGQ